MSVNFKPGDFVVIKEDNKMLWGVPPAFPIGQVAKIVGDIAIIRNFSVLNDTTNMQLMIRKRPVRTCTSFIEALDQSHPFYEEYMNMVVPVMV